MAFRRFSPVALQNMTRLLPKKTLMCHVSL